MRTFIFLFCSTVFSLSPGDLFSQDVKIAIDTDKEITVDEIFEIIKTQTNYRFVYKSDVFKNAPKVNLKKGLINAHDLLVKSLSFGNLYYELAPNRTIILKEKNTKIFQQSIKGLVTDNNGLPLSGVAVSIQGSYKGTLTDFDGSYVINALEGQILVFSYLGKKGVSKIVGDETIINVTLEDDTETLEETIVVAYGTSKKSSYVGSVSTIKAEEIAERPISNVAQSFEGSIPGLEVNSNYGGRPGAAPSIVIRGVGSARGFGASAPLYVIDGFVYDLPEDRILNLDQFDPLSSINPSDIESVSILKDASAASLYGSRAANGVILITTKKGKGKPKFNFRIQQGAVSLANPLRNTVDNKPQYYELMWQGLRNEFISNGNNATTASSLATDNLISRLGYNVYDVPDNELVNNLGVFNPNANLLYNDFDWWDAITRPAIRTNVGGDISGGTDKSDYFVSVGYTKDEGYLLNSKLDRYSARINTNSQVTDWLKVGINLNASHRIGIQDAVVDAQITRNPLTFATLQGPIYPIHVIDPATGNAVLDPLGDPLFDFGNNNPFHGNRPYGNGQHPIANNILNSSTSTNTILSGRSNLDITFLKDFKFRNGISIDIYNFFDKAFSYDEDLENRETNRAQYNQLGITLNQLLFYNKNFGDHLVDVTLGHESYSYTSEGFSAGKSGQTFEGIETLSNFNELSSISGNISERTLESYFSRLNYEFKDKYFASVSYRRDGTSILDKNSRWGSFYSAGLGWQISKESFMNAVTWVDYLKLRVSHGTSGNVAGFSAYESQARYLNQDNAFESGFVPLTEGGRDLVWEGQKLTDIGLDFTLFGNRLSGTVDYYIKDSDNLIFNVPQASSLGIRFDALNKNIGKINNKGLEIQLQGDIVKTENFNWNLNVNASTQKTKTVKLSEGKDVDASTRLISEGKDFHEFYLRDYVGVNPANGDPLYRGLRSPDVYDPARDIIVANDTLTSSYSAAQRHLTGKSFTPDVFGGITNTFTYKGFSLIALLNYTIGGYMIDSGYISLAVPSYGRAAHADLLNAWKAPGDDTDVPRFDPTNVNNLRRITSRTLFSRTHLNLRRVTLKYQFPKDFLEALNASNASLYVSGENLALFSKQKGINPTSGFQDTATFHPSKIITLGLNIGF